MSDDFYMTIATMLPVLLLALIWDSRAMENIRLQDRQLRKDDPVHGVWFWTKRRVRIYTLVVATVIVTAVGLSVLRISGVLSNTLPLRIFMLASVALTLGTLLTRIWVDVIAATASPPAPGDVPPETVAQSGKAGDQS
jgi:hypothetical protein